MVILDTLDCKEPMGVMELTFQLQLGQVGNISLHGLLMSSYFLRFLLFPPAFAHLPLFEHIWWTMSRMNWLKNFMVERRTEKKKLFTFHISCKCEPNLSKNLSLNLTLYLSKHLSTCLSKNLSRNLPCPKVCPKICL